MRTIVYGNSKSRLKWDLNIKLDNVTTWGCNRIFNDIAVDNLVSIDHHVQHMIYESGYAHKNKCYFADWNILPESFANTKIMITGDDMKVTENEKGNRQSCVVNGKFYGEGKGLWITWIDEVDMVESIDYPQQWCSGTTAIHLACQQNPSEVYLMGFDVSENPLNNVYEEQQMSQGGAYKRKHYKSSEDFGHRSDWAREIETTIREFPNIEFIWAEPHEKSVKFDYDNLTYDTYENIRRNICR